MSSKIFLVVNILLVVGLLLASCTPAAEPTPVPAPTRPPAVAPTPPQVPETTPLGPTPKPAVPPALTPTPLPPTPSPTVSEKPRYGGILRLPVMGDAPTFDLHQTSTYYANHPLSPMYNMLVQQDTQNYTKIVPDLAERWEVTPDGLTWTFHMAKGIKWHDGKPFSSADAKTSLEKIYDPKPGVVSLRKDSFAAIKSVETPDENTLVINLKQPSASLLLNLSAGWNVIYPKHILDVKGTMAKDINGTGPFKFVEYVRGVAWTLQKSPSYFKKDLPYLDGLVYYIVPDRGSNLAALRTKRIHASGVGHDITPPEITVVTKEIPEMVIQKHWMIFWTGMNMPLYRWPWSDIRARQALSLAINREVIWNVLDHGWGEPGGTMPPGQWGLTREKLESIPGYKPWKESNIEEAKKLLKEVGVPEGFKVVLLTRKYDLYENLNVIVKGALVKVGIDASILIKETAAWYDSMYAMKGSKHTWEGFDLNPWLQGAAMDDPDFIFGENVVTGAVRNLSDYSNPRVDELYEKQSQTMDPVERKKIVNEIDYAFLSEFGKIMFYWRFKAMAHWPEMKGYKIANIYYNNSRLEDVWLAK